MCIGAIESTYPALAELVEDHERLLGTITSGDVATALDGIDTHMGEAIERIDARSRDGMFR